MQRAKRAQKDMIETASAAVRREARKIKPRDMVEAILGQAAAAAENVIALPRAATAHTTDALKAALAAVERPIPASQQLDTAALARQAEIEADLASYPDDPPENVQRLRKGTTPQLRFRRSLELQARVDAGEDIPLADALWLGGYRAGPEFRALQLTYEDFGEAALR